MTASIAYTSRRKSCQSFSQKPMQREKPRRCGELPRWSRSVSSSARLSWSRKLSARDSAGERADSSTGSGRGGEWRTARAGGAVGAVGGGGGIAELGAGVRAGVVAVARADVGMELQAGAVISCCTANDAASSACTAGLARSATARAAAVCGERKLASSRPSTCGHSATTCPLTSMLTHAGDIPAPRCAGSDGAVASAADADVASRLRVACGIRPADDVAAAWLGAACGVALGSTSTASPPSEEKMAVPSGKVPAATPAARAAAPAYRRIARRVKTDSSSTSSTLRSGVRILVQKYLGAYSLRLLAASGPMMRLAAAMRRVWSAGSSCSKNLSTLRVEAARRVVLTGSRYFGSVPVSSMPILGITFGRPTAARANGICSRAISISSCRSLLLYLGAIPAAQVAQPARGAQSDRGKQTTRNERLSSAVRSMFMCRSGRLR